MAKVSVDPVLLRSMLKNRHKTVEQAASDMELKHGTLAEYLNTETEIELTDIKRIARYFKKPWTYLLLTGEEQLPKIRNDNRTLRNKQAGITAEMIRELEKANLTLTMANELFPDVKAEIYRPPAIQVARPGSLAKAVRETLGITLEKQMSFPDEYAALRAWVGTLQAKGIYVAQRKIPEEDIRAYSLKSYGKALIVVDTSDTPYARIFSLFHEYCHLMSNSTGICDLSEHSRIELRCNRFAAELLMPRPALIETVRGHSFGEDIEADDKFLGRISRLFSVSVASLLLRLQEIEVISYPYYNVLEDRRRSRYKGKKGGFADPNIRALNSVGTKLAGDIFSAMDSGNIDRKDVGVLFGVGEHRVDMLKERFYAAGS